MVTETTSNLHPRFSSYLCLTCPKWCQNPKAWLNTKESSQVKCHRHTCMLQQSQIHWLDPRRPCCMIQMECEKSKGAVNVSAVPIEKDDMWKMVWQRKPIFIFKLFRIVESILNDYSAFYKAANSLQVSTLHASNKNNTECQLQLTNSKI